MPEQKMQKRGISIHIGVNEVDRGHYDSKLKLSGCENDARAMAALAESQNFDSVTLLTSLATRGNVWDAIEGAARKLNSGDMLFVTYAGHGTQIVDRNKDEGDEDGKDETWLLYDGMLIDDELKILWSLFEPGVRILLLSDSCHSGTVSRNPFANPKMRFVSSGRAQQVLDLNPEFYDRLLVNLPNDMNIEIRCTVMLISAVQDDQMAADLDETGDYPQNGLFTSRLKTIWSDGDFKGNYFEFYEKLFENITDAHANKAPNYLVFGAENKDFEAEKPFTI